MKHTHNAQSLCSEPYAYMHKTRAQKNAEQVEGIALGRPFFLGMRRHFEEHRVFPDDLLAVDLCVLSESPDAGHLQKAGVEFTCLPTGNGGLRDTSDLGHLGLGNAEDASADMEHGVHD